MCLILLAHRVHPDFPLVLAANRDEFHDRPTAPLARWSDSPQILGGRDLKSGGSWLAVSEEGRWAAVTNFRDPSTLRSNAPSRGGLVVEFVTGTESPAEYARSLSPSAATYNGFNLLVGAGDEIVWFSNRASPSDPRLARPLPPGVYGLSNDLLDTPWPKVAVGKESLRQIVARLEQLSTTALLDLLMDRTFAADHELPTTGVPLQLERALSATFITTPEYGTRCSTAMILDRTGRILVAERRFDSRGRVTGEDRIAF